MADERLSNDTYARLCASGDHDGDMIGSLELAIRCWFSPSASATINVYCCFGGVPSALTKAMRVENAPRIPVSCSNTRSAIRCDIARIEVVVAVSRWPARRWPLRTL